ncbi:unnamed protein product [Urochloa humidicola]
MATARAAASMAMFLVVALSASHMASSLRPGAGGLGVCRASGYLPGRSGNCEKSNDPDCCEDGKEYPQYRCSPPVTASTKAVLTLNSFEKGKDGGGPSECDNAYHSDEEKVVALSTGWSRIWDSGRMGRISPKFAHFSPARDKLSPAKKIRVHLNF